MKKLYFILGLCFLTSASALAFAAYTTFQDLPEGAWYAEAVNHLAALNILQGHPDGTYRPLKSVNRAELAVAMDRLLEYVETGTVKVETTKSLELDVPFTAQAPTGKWVMPYQEACEEAALIMVKYFLTGEELNADKANQEILDLLAWEEAHGYGVDVSAADLTAIAQDYYDLNATMYYDEDVTIQHIKTLLNAGHPVIIPAAGQILANPNYTGDGPPYHMIVIIGYNATGFITHDPGVRVGASYEYSYETVASAIHDWTGSKSTVAAEGRKAMLVLE